MNRLRVCLTKLMDIKSMNYESRRQIKRWVSPVQVELTARKKAAKVVIEPKRNTFLDWNRDAELYAFSKRLLEEFDTAKLDQAFTHKNYAYSEESRMKKLEMGENISIPHNEELIQRGWEVTSKAVYTYLENNLKSVPQEVIKALRDYLMRHEVLAKASLHIGTRDIILTEEYPVEETTLANTFLAIVAALEQSTNANRAANFVKDFLIVALADKDLTEMWTPSNPVEYLNDLLAKSARPSAEPRIIGHTGRNTLLSAYHIGMYSNQEFLGSGFGDSIQEAMDIAALNAIFRIFGLLDSSTPLRFNTEININS